MKSQKRHLQRSEILLLLALISLGVLFRLIKISQPFVDAWSWRQADVAMIAENFYLHGFNIFYPQINWAGINPGYVGTEFPFVPFIASLHYAVLGIQDWIGRSVSVFFFAVSVPFFYLLVRKYLHAFFISIVYFPYHMFGSGLLRIAGVSKYAQILLGTLTSNLTPVTAVLMAIGMILPTDNQFGRLFHWWLLGIIVFVVFVGEGNFRHAWYQLPLVPVAAAFAGAALDFSLAKLGQAYRSRLVPFVTVISFFSLLSYLSYFHVKPLYAAWALPSWKAGNEINRIAPPGALIIVPGSGDPTTIYYSKRRGWHYLGDGRIGSFPANSELAINDVENLRRKGAAYFVLTKDTLWYLDWYKGLERHLNSHYRQISDGHDYLIFDLAKKS